MDSHSNPEVMTVKEMAAHLHVPKSTARKIIRRGHVRYQRLGKRWIVPFSDVQAFIDSGWKREGQAA
jgi:excisionase family DNA binding protein